MKNAITPLQDYDIMSAKNYKASGECFCFHTRNLT